MLLKKVGKFILKKTYPQNEVEYKKYWVIFVIYVFTNAVG